VDDAAHDAEEMDEEEGDEEEGYEQEGYEEEEDEEEEDEEEEDEEEEHEEEEHVEKEKNKCRYCDSDDITETFRLLCSLCKKKTPPMHLACGSISRRPKADCPFFCLECIVSHSLRRQTERAQSRTFRERVEHRNRS